MGKIFFIIIIMVTGFVLSCNSKEEIFNSEDAIQYYKPDSIKYNLIKASDFNKDWVNIKIIEKKDRHDYDVQNMDETMSVEIIKDINNDGKNEKIISGVYLDVNSNYGSFLAVLNDEGNLIKTIVADKKPRLVTFRDAGSEIYFGTRYGTEYFYAIKYIDNDIKVVSLEE